MAFYLRNSNKLNKSTLTNFELFKTIRSTYKEKDENTYLKRQSLKFRPLDNRTQKTDKKKSFAPLK